MILRGEKIDLRDWQSSDLDAFRQWNTGHFKWMDFNGPYYPRKSVEEIEQQIQQYQEQIASENWGTPRQRLVISVSGTERMLGTVSWYWQSEETNWKSIGIAIYDDAYWSKGLGREAMKLWVDYLFGSDSTLVRLDLRTWSGNPGMIKLAQRLGFKEEARFRKARIVNGEYYDSVAMGILKEEWLDLNL